MKDSSQCPKFPGDKKEDIWNVIKKKTWKGATAHMIHAQEKGSAVSASPIILGQEIFLPAVFQKMPRPHMTDLSSILPGLSMPEKYRNG
jgi:hypothetical protein